MTTGFVFPNEAEVWWGFLIVLYPYITGLVAGAFIVSALYHVFNRRELEPVGRLALVTALSFLMVAPMPLLLHLGQPVRGLEIMWTPNPTSAMAGFGYIYSFYLVLLLLEVWFVFRKDIVTYARQSTGIARLGYTVLSLGAGDISPRALEEDHRITRVLATIGIPAAAFLHGYVGFIFGSIKANPWWSTPLQPIIFLLSAIISGIALLILVYAVTSRFRHQPMEAFCLMGLNKYLWYFLILDVSLEGLEVISKMYEAEEAWPMIYALLTQQIPFTFFGLQLGLGAVLPLVLLGIGRRVAWRAGQALTLASAVLILVGVFAMRWNVVVGGQLISRSLRGFTAYTPTFLGTEGVLAGVVVLVLPLVILSIVARIIPPWEERVAGAETPAVDVEITA